MKKMKKPPYPKPLCFGTKQYSDNNFICRRCRYHKRCKKDADKRIIWI
jgi:hypothetical protein